MTQDDRSLEELQRTIDRMRAPTAENADNSAARANSNVVRVAAELIGGVVAGGVLGYYIDQWAGTSPWFFLVFFMLGFAAGLRNAIRTTKENASADSQAEP